MSIISTGIKLDEETRNRLQTLGQKIDRSPHWLMKTAIEHYLEEQERYWQEREEDMKRWQDYQLTGDAVPHSEVSEWLASIGTDDERPCPM